MAWLTDKVKKVLSNPAKAVRSSVTTTLDNIADKETQARFKKTWIDQPYSAVKSSGGGKLAGNVNFALANISTGGAADSKNWTVGTEEDMDSQFNESLGEEGRKRVDELDAINYAVDEEDPVLQTEAPVYQGPQESDVDFINKIIAQRAARTRNRSASSYGLGSSGATTSGQTLGGA